MAHFHYSRILLAVLALGAGAPSITSAQSTPYSAPGVIQGISENPRELLDQAIENARWKFGAVRVDPWIGVDRLGYVSNTVGQLTDSGEDDDYLAVASAGIQAYLPIGNKALVTAHIRPQYNWWQHQDERSGINEVMGASALGLYNRMQVEFSVDRNEQLGVVTRELEQELVYQTDTARFDAVINLFRRIDLVAGARIMQFESVDRSSAVQSRFAALDREETVSRLGLRFATGQANWALGVQQSEARFDDANRNRDNSGTSLFVSGQIEASRSWLSLDIVNLDLEPEAGAHAIVPISETTGRIELGFRSRSDTLDTVLYLRQALNYTLTEDSNYLITTSSGIRLGLTTGRSNWSTYFETGSDDYKGGAQSSDDRTAYGFDYGFPLGDKASFSASFSHSEVEASNASSLGIADRDIDRFSLGITFTPFGTTGRSPSINGSGL